MTEETKTRRQRQVYAFIDTNIFLDFYRQSNDATLRLLERLKPVRDRIICTYQVEMEFLKNRQTVLLNALKELKTPDPSTPPAIFADSATNKSLRAVTNTAKKKADLIRKRTLTLLEKPKQNDPVYQTLESVFHSHSEHVLTRDMHIRQTIKRRAWRRFLLGYPPRKTSDTSIGDALNWEWIIHCASNLQGRIVIVSRDADYGVGIKDKFFLNDQLRQELRDRVGRKSVLYTHRLSDALKQLSVQVPEDELEAESESLKRQGRKPRATVRIDELLKALEIEPQSRKA